MKRYVLRSVYDVSCTKWQESTAVWLNNDKSYFEGMLFFFFKNFSQVFPLLPAVRKEGLQHLYVIFRDVNQLFLWLFLTAMPNAGFLGTNTSAQNSAGSLKEDCTSLTFTSSAPFPNKTVNHSVNHGASAPKPRYTAEDYIPAPLFFCILPSHSSPSSPPSPCGATAKHKGRL